MPAAHFHGTNAEITVFKGFCEIQAQHYHPIFLLLGIDQTRKKFWILTQVLDENNGHGHTCEITQDDIEEFLETGEVNVKTKDGGHMHQVYFNEDERQGFVVDPLEVLRDIRGMNSEEEEDEQDEE